MSQEIILKVAPLGDAVMCATIASRLISYGLSVRMAVSKLGATLLGNTGIPLTTEAVTAPLVIDVCDYLKQDCHHAKFKGSIVNDNYLRGGFAHLVTWMTRHIEMELGRMEVTLPTSLDVGPCNVKLPVTELQQKKVHQLLLTEGIMSGKRPLVIMAAEAGSPNRRISPETLQEVAIGLEEQMDIALLTPLPTLSMQLVIKG